MMPTAHVSTSERDYAGRELEAMAFAVNYHRWILEFFQPFLGTRIVEVGAGAGSFSELLREREIESLSLVEPSPAMYRLLLKRLGEDNKDSRIRTYNALFGDVAAEIKSGQNPDSIIYVNVLEHIAGDEGELRTIHQTLCRGGRIFVLVPALHWLYSKFDVELGHERRYSSAELHEKLQGAGFKVLSSRYLDMIGIVPWLIKYRLLRSTTMEAGAVNLYDKCVVPISRTIESFVSPPIGKNVILIGERP
jgi:SAM-dependent methyltransferase